VRRTLDRAALYGMAEQAAEKRTIFGSLLLPVLFFPAGLDPDFLQGVRFKLRPAATV